MMTSTGLNREWDVVSSTGRARRAGQGFTLIEVLVVVAIIALLISILLPALKRAREQTRRVLCSTNMRTIMQATNLYLHSNSDYFPWNAAESRPGVPYGPNAWEMLHTYVQKGTPERFTDWAKCPRVAQVDRDRADKFWTILSWYMCANDEFYHTSGQTSPRVFPDGTTKHIEYMLSHCMASRTCYQHVNGEAKAPYKAGTVKRQADMVIFPEYGDDVAMCGDGWELRDNNDLNNQTCYQVRHLQGQNCAYLDQHVSFHRLNMGDTRQWGLPPFPQAFVANWKPGDYDGEFDNWHRPAPH